MTNKIRLIVFIGIIFVTAVVLGVSVKSYANDKKGKAYREAVERNESEYVREIRRYVGDCGFKNAGINLTKEFDAERNITYKLVINHHSFEYADSEKLSNMENTLCMKASEKLEGKLVTEFSF